MIDYLIHFYGGEWAKMTLMEWASMFYFFVILISIVFYIVIWSHDEWKVFYGLFLLSGIVVLAPLAAGFTYVASPFIAMFLIALLIKKISKKTTEA